MADNTNRDLLEKIEEMEINLRNLMDSLEEASETEIQNLTENYNNQINQIQEEFQNKANKQFPILTEEVKILKDDLKRKKQKIPKLERVCKHTNDLLKIGQQTIAEFEEKANSTKEIEAEKDEEINALKRQLTELQEKDKVKDKKINELQTNVKGLENEVSATLKLIKKNETRKEKDTEKCIQLKEKIGRKEKHVVDMTKKVDDMNTKIEELVIQLEKQLDVDDKSQEINHLQTTNNKNQSINEMETKAASLMNNLGEETLQDNQPVNGAAGGDAEVIAQNNIVEKCKELNLKGLKGITNDIATLEKMRNNLKKQMKLILQDPSIIKDAKKLAKGFVIQLRFVLIEGLINDLRPPGKTFEQRYDTLKVDLNNMLNMDPERFKNERDGIIASSKLAMPILTHLCRHGYNLLADADMDEQSKGTINYSINDRLLNIDFLERLIRLFNEEPGPDTVGAFTATASHTEGPNG